MIDQILEEEYHKNKSYLIAEREYEESKLMQELYEQDVEIIIGRGRKRRENEQFGVVRKLPRIIKHFQFKYRRLQGTGGESIRPKWSISDRMFV